MTSGTSIKEGTMILGLFLTGGLLEVLGKAVLLLWYDG